MTSPTFDGAFFVQRDDSRFEATGHARGPWHELHCHGGPPAALVGRAVERVLGPEFFVARASYELVRPVPVGEIVLEVGEPAGGRRIKRVNVTVSSGGKTLMSAVLTGVLRREVSVPAKVAGMKAPGEPPPAPTTVEAHTFPFFRTKVGYHTAMEVRVVRGEFGRGRATAWFRPRVPLLAGESLTALQRTLLAADSGNGVSNVLDTREFGFLNPDLTVNLHRPLTGEWVALDAYTRAHGTGVGMAHSQLWDEAGSLGHATQTLLIAAVEG